MFSSRPLLTSDRWFLVEVPPRMGCLWACLVPDGSPRPRRPRWSCRMRNGSVPPCLPHTSLDVYTDLKTQTLIMIRAKYSILKISTLCFCGFLTYTEILHKCNYWVNWGKIVLCFVGNFSKSCLPFQQCPCGMRAAITAHLYLSSFVAMACKHLTEGTGDSKQET